MMILDLSYDRCNDILGEKLLSEIGFMDALSAVGNWASIIGCLVSFYTLYKVETLPGALRKRSRDRYLSELTDTVTRQSVSTETLTEPVTQQVELVVDVIREHYLSWVPFRHRALKGHVKQIDKELKGQKRRDLVQHHLRLIRNEMSIGQ